VFILPDFEDVSSGTVSSRFHDKEAGFVLLARDFLVI
jgi:hypothetical protein